jgi:hypothetical protein
MNAPTDWASALAILAAGLILGTLVFFLSRRRKASDAAKRRELEARRDALMQQLRDLAEDSADGERAWIEKEAAEILRELDRLPAAPPASPLPAKQRTAAAGFVWGVVCTLLAAGIVYYASTFAGNNTNVDAQIVQPKDAFARNASMQTKQAPVAATDALPPNHPPLSGHEAMTTMPPAASSQPIHITLSLDASTPQQGGVIYVIARGTEAGHPVAVRRIDTNAFPVTIDLDNGDAMMGGALPERVRIEARLDSDGDAGTNDPNDLRAFAERVTAGSSVELKLARVN